MPGSGTFVLPLVELVDPVQLRLQPPDQLPNQLACAGALTVSASPNVIETVRRVLRITVCPPCK